MTSEIYQGICQGGPKHRSPMVTQDKRKVDLPGDESGFYVHKPANGPEPAAWLWIERKPKK